MLRDNKYIICALASMYGVSRLSKDHASESLRTPLCFDGFDASTMCIGLARERAWQAFARTLER